MLRDGRTATLRRLTEADFPSAYELHLAEVASGEGQIRTAAEKFATLEEFAEKLRPWVSGEHSGWHGLLLVAVLSGRVVGEGRVRRHPYRRIRHNGTISVGVHLEYQGQGVGRALMNAMIEWSREHSFADAARREGGVTRLDLAVFAENTRAIALYHSLGFTTIGRRTGYIRMEDGRMVDDFEMELSLGE